MELPQSSPGVLLSRSAWEVPTLLEHAEKSLLSGDLDTAEGCINTIVFGDKATPEQREEAMKLLEILARCRGLAAMQQSTAYSTVTVLADPPSPIIINAPDYVLENAGRPAPWPRKRKPPVAKFKRAVDEIREAAAMSREAQEEKGIHVMREETKVAVKEILPEETPVAKAPEEPRARKEEKEKVTTKARSPATKTAGKKTPRKQATAQNSYPTQNDFGQDIYERLSMPLRQDWEKVDTELVHEFCHSIREDTPREELQAKLNALLEQIADKDLRKRISEHLIRLFVINNLIKGSHADAWTRQLQL